MEQKKIAVIGAGNMGAALLRGMVKAHWAKPANLMATHPRESRRRELEHELGVRVSASNLEGAQFADILILGIKPQILKKVLTEIAPAITPDKLVVSIAAGITTKSMEDILAPGVPVVRSMPNLGVTVGLGASAYCRGAGAREEHAAAAKAIFEAVGMALEVDEYQMDAVTGLSGTGPMYIFQILEGLSDAGVKVGLSRHVATQLAMHTVLGSAKMAVETGKHPAMLKDMVTSPGGTAITALHSMERNGLRALLIDAVEAATKRSKELGDLQSK